jgi:hypothetical protein
MVRGGVGEEPNHTTTRKLALYKSFNPLWEEGGRKIWAKMGGSQKSRRDALTVRTIAHPPPALQNTPSPKPCKETDITEGALEKNIFIFPETFQVQ